MTNASSTYFSIMIGAIIGALISWWIYNRQKKISELQDRTLERIRQLNERHMRCSKEFRRWKRITQATPNSILKIEKRLEQLMKGGQ